MQRHLAPSVDDALATDLELIVSELATNAYCHGVDPVELRIRCAHAEVRVEIADGSPVAPEDLPRHVGMQVVSALSTSWGVTTRPGGEGKCVWSRVGLDRPRGT